MGAVTRRRMSLPPSIRAALARGGGPPPPQPGGQAASALLAATPHWTEEALERDLERIAREHHEDPRRTRIFDDWFKMDPRNGGAVNRSALLQARRAEVPPLGLDDWYTRKVDRACYIRITTP